VTIAWNVDDEDDATSAVNLRWRESGGPRVTPRAAGGFGTRLSNSPPGRTSAVAWNKITIPTV
jgi:two-component sensor histidine kinase